jgi:hypothetical protein
MSLALCLSASSALAAIAGMNANAVVLNEKTGQVVDFVDYHIEPGALDSPNASIIKLDITGAESWDLLGDADNLVVVIDVAGIIGAGTGNPAVMEGIGWRLSIATVGASWQSEARLYFDDNVAPDLSGLFLRPGAGFNAPGNSDFSSGGVIKLADVAIPDIALPDGFLRLDFHETYDDVDGAVDAVFDTQADGSPSFLDIQVTPEPATLALLGLGGLALIRRRR